MNMPAVESYVQSIRGSSTTIGCQNVTLACDEFCRSSEPKNIAVCHKALLQLIREFYHTRDVINCINTVPSSQKHCIT
ncbi:hypothetical protein MKX01_027180 [Papaver californicum]|nr:hypothetical protein MKX01_027180 [Papaver californicum]